MPDPSIVRLWSDVKKQWSGLSEAVAARSIDGARSMSEHGELISHTVALVEEFSDYYGLTLDPDADGYYLQSALAIDGLRMAEITGQLRGRGAAALASHQLSEFDRASLTVTVRALVEARDHFEAQIDKAYEANPALKTALATQTAASMKSA